MKRTIKRIVDGLNNGYTEAGIIKLTGVSKSKLFKKI
jgi:hypothetical protein